MIPGCGAGQSMRPPRGMGETPSPSTKPACRVPAADTSTRRPSAASDSRSRSARAQNSRAMLPKPSRASVTVRGADAAAVVMLFFLVMRALGRVVRGQAGVRAAAPAAPEPPPAVLIRSVQRRGDDTLDLVGRAVR